MKNDISHRLAAPPSVPTRQILWRGIRGRCPRCGEGKLFKSYIGQNQSCSHCGEATGDIRADDGPAWLTILVTGHLVTPLIGYFALHETMSQLLAIILLAAIVIAMACLILPRAKGLFIAMIWLSSQKAQD